MISSTGQKCPKRMKRVWKLSIPMVAISPRTPMVISTIGPAIERRRGRYCGGGACGGGATFGVCVGLPMVHLAFLRLLDRGWRRRRVTGAGLARSNVSFARACDLQELH